MDPKLYSGFGGYATEAEKIGIVKLGVGTALGSEWIQLSTLGTEWIRLVTSNVSETPKPVRTS